MGTVNRRQQQETRAGYHRYASRYTVLNERVVGLQRSISSSDTCIRISSGVVLKFVDAEEDISTRVLMLAFL